MNTVPWTVESGMMINEAMKGWLKRIFLPPMFLLWVILMGLVFKSWLAWLALVTLYLLSTTPIASLLARSLESHSALTLPLAKKDEGVIVVLGGGMPGFSPEMPGYRPSTSTLERLRYAGWLQKQTGLPLLVSGGGYRPEAVTMAESLENDFDANVQWLEDRSVNTWENALFSREMLPEQYQTVILVTHAWHMQRSVLSFETVGFRVIPAPTAFHSERVHWKRLRHWFPEVRNLLVSEHALREYIGYLWYRLSYT